MNKFEAVRNMVTLMENYPQEFSFNTVSQGGTTHYTIRHPDSNIQLIFQKQDTRHGDAFAFSSDSSFNFADLADLERAASIADDNIGEAIERKKIQHDNEMIEILIRKIKK